LALTTLKKAFVREYLLDPERDGTKAAIRAGYSEDRAKRQAEELLAQSDIQAAFISASRELLQPFGVSPQSVLDGLVYNIKACRANGSDVLSLAEARKNLELVGRHLGMFADKMEVDISDKLVALLKSRQQKARPKAEPETLPAEVVTDPPVERPLTVRKYRSEVRRQEKQSAIEAWKQLTQPSKPSLN